MYITGAPPVYTDPWNTTKLLGGYVLSINGSRIGVGPGRTACGPSAMGPCLPVQPYDGYDVTATAQAAAVAGVPLPLRIESYGLPQPTLGIAPAVQAVLVVRFSGGGASEPPFVWGTTPDSGGAWLAQAGDALRRPSGNKAPFWWV